MQKKFLCVKKVALSEVRKVSANEIFLIRDKGVFSAHAKQTEKEKLFSAHNDTDFALQQN